MDEILKAEMAKKKKRKESSLLGDVKEFTRAGMGLSIGVVAIAKVQEGSGINVTPAFATMGSMMSPLATTMMAGHALRGVSRLRRIVRREIMKGKKVT